MINDITLTRYYLAEVDFFESYLSCYLQPSD